MAAATSGGQVVGGGGPFATRTAGRTRTPSVARIENVRIRPPGWCPSKSAVAQDDRRLASRKGRRADQSVGRSGSHRVAGHDLQLLEVVTQALVAKAQVEDG